MSKEIEINKDGYVEPPAAKAATPAPEYPIKDAKELACDFLWENSKQPIEGYQSVRKLFDEWYSKNTYHQTKNAPPVSREEGKRVIKYLIENENEEWYFPSLEMWEHSSITGTKRRDCSWVKDANNAMQFDSFEQAKDKMELSDDIHDTVCKVTEHEFVSAAPVSDAVELDAIREANRVLNMGIKQMVREQATEQYNKWKDDFCKRHDLCSVCITGGYECDSDHK